MSSTEIYLVSTDSCIEIGETKNGFRGAMFVWDQIAIKYFKLEGFPNFDTEMQRRVWNAANEHPLTDAERIVLASTMDWVVVRTEDAQRLIVAFKEYGEDNPRCSIGEQGAIINSAELPPGHFIAWNQTTVGDFALSPEWFDFDEDDEEYNEDNDENGYYEFNNLSKTWDLFEQFDLLSKTSS
ncbi:hypothetical protein LMH73_019135 [Vibrio splendidus]|nr:hypothetical protein [Vibrio splendidus]MCC4883102.1 hypothetical protein [Vibrio splendidus]